MGSYPILTTRGLKLMAAHGDWFTPSGNRWEIVSNGLLGGELLYDPKTKKVYGLALKEIKDPGADFIAQCEGDIALDKVRHKMGYAEAHKWLAEHVETI